MDGNGTNTSCGNIVIAQREPNSLRQFEDTKGVIIIRKSKKARQHNDQRKKDKQ